MLHITRRRFTLPLVAVSLFACSSDDSQGSLTLGEPRDVLTQSVDPGGGAITVQSASDALDGLTIEVPDGAFAAQTEFRITSRPITAHSYGDKVNPLTELISVENGHDHADEALRVTIPVSVPEGHFAGAFFYDEKTGELEALPLIEIGPTSITVATRHFSDVMVSSIAFDLLAGDIETTFKMPDDWWQFPNLPTYLGPGGMCSGMSVSALFYHDVLRSQGGALHGQHDNDGNSPKSPEFFLDDRMAIKLASTAQVYEEREPGQSYDYWYGKGESKGPVWSFYMAAYSMLLSKKPQYLSIFTATEGEAGHALIAYRKTGRELWVADPNLPLDETARIKIDLDNGVMENYESRWNIGTDKITFTKLFFLARTAVVDYENIAELWEELGKGVVGDQYPAYTMSLRTAGGQEEVKDSADIDGVTPQVSVAASFDWRVDAYKADNSLMVEGKENSPTTLTLDDGENRVGLHVLAKVRSDVTKQDEWVWTDFRWITLSAKEDTSVDCVPGSWAFHSYEYKSGCSYLSYDDIDWPTRTKLTLQDGGTIIQDGKSVGEWSAGYDQINKVKRLSLDFDYSDTNYSGALSVDCGEVGGLSSSPPLGGVGLPRTGCWKARKQ